MDNLRPKKKDGTLRHSDIGNTKGNKSLDELLKNLRKSSNDTLNRKEKG